MQAKISGPDTLLKLYVAIDEDRKALQPHGQANTIVLLNQLFRWPVPAELCGGKAKRFEKRGEAVFHLGEGFMHGKLFA
jgi:hypothetical protein